MAENRSCPAGCEIGVDAKPQAEAGVVVAGEFGDAPLGGGVDECSDLNGTFRAVDFLAGQAGENRHAGFPVHRHLTQQFPSVLGGGALDEHFQLGFEAEQMDDAGAADPIVVQALGCQASGGEARSQRSLGKVVVEGFQPRRVEKLTIPSTGVIPLTKDRQGKPELDQLMDDLIHGSRKVPGERQAKGWGCENIQKAGCRAPTFAGRNRSKTSKFPRMNNLHGRPYRILESSRKIRFWEFPNARPGCERWSATRAFQVR